MPMPQLDRSAMRLADVDIPTFTGVDLTIVDAAVPPRDPAVKVMPAPPEVTRMTLSASLGIPSKVSHRRWHKPLAASQGSRGTCWAFAGIAALEAAYARAGVDCALSEQYLFHAVRSWQNSLHDVDPDHFLTSSLVGFQGSTDVVRHLSALSVCERAAAPYIDGVPLQRLWDSIPQIAAESADLEKVDWFEYDLRNIPLPARSAARYGVAEWDTVPQTVDAMRAAIAAGHDLVISVGDHILLAIGYDDAAREFEIKNSWQSPGFETLKYQDDPRFVLAQDTPAYFIKKVKPVAVQWGAAWLGRWSMDHDGWRGKLIVRAFVRLNPTPLVPDAKNQIPIGTWYGEDGRRLAATGWYDEGGTQLHANIGGQSFDLRLDTSDPTHAAGSTTWNGQRFGVSLSRLVVSGAGPAQAVERRYVDGAWELQQGSLAGTVRLVPGATTFIADENGARGTASVDESHLPSATVDVQLPGVGQAKLALTFHTHEHGIASGQSLFTSPPLATTARLAENLYIRRRDGRLDWAAHTGRPSLAPDWKQQGVGTGWNGLSRVFGGRDGVIYGVTAEGDLQWYFHRGRAAGTFDWVGPKKVGVGWGDVVDVTPGDGGVLYAVSREGSLSWFRHIGRREGTFDWLGPVKLAMPIPARLLRTFAAAPGGVVYAIDENGDLLWFRHRGADYGFPIWQGPVTVGVGWNEVVKLVATGSGYLYALFGSGARAGELWLYRHRGALTGRFDWRDGARVGTGWQGGDVIDFFAT